MNISGSIGAINDNNHPWQEQMGYEHVMRAEDHYGTAEQRDQDDYYLWIAGTHPENRHVEMLHGEHADMYYIPQTSSLPVDACVKS